MTQEEIENAGRIEREKIINELQDGYNNHHHDINLYTVASATIGQYALPLFIAGANWRINSVWHNDTEKPDTDKGDLLVGIEVMGKTAYIRQNAYYVLQFGCVRWAYVEDLIPNKED